MGFEILDFGFPAIGSLQRRAAGILLVMFGQPYSRIATLPVDDVILAEPGAVSVRLPGGTVPLPHPIGQVVADLVVHRPT